MKALSQLYSVLGENYMDIDNGYPAELVKVLEEYDKHYETVSNLKLIETIANIDTKWEINKLICDDWECEAINESIFHNNEKESFLYLSSYLGYQKWVYLVVGVDALVGEINGYMMVEENEKKIVYFPEISLMRHVIDAISASMIKSGRFNDGKKVAEWGVNFRNSKKMQEYILEEKTKSAVRKSKRLMKKFSNQMLQGSSNDIDAAIEEYKQHMQSYYEIED